MRTKLEIGKHNNDFAYIDITLHTSNNGDDIVQHIADRLNEMLNLNCEVVGCPQEEENGRYIDSISFDYNRGEMEDTYKDIKRAWKRIKQELTKM